MQPSIWQLLIVAALVLILFGRGRISEMMGDVGKGIKSFKKGLTDEEMAEKKKEDTPPKRLEGPGVTRTTSERDSTKTTD